MKYRLEDICSFRKEKVAVSSLTLKNYISTENMLPNKAGITKATSLPNAILHRNLNVVMFLYQTFVLILKKYGKLNSMVDVRMMY